VHFHQDHSTEIHLLSKYISDLFGVAVDGMEQKREAEAENRSGKECRENGDLLPTDLNPRIHEEAYCQHDERNEACTRCKHQQLLQ